MKFSPAIKGVITAVVMIIIILVLYYTNQPGNTPFAYAVYAVYALGIVWTLLSYRASESYTGKFSELFSQAFRCFIVVTLLMVAFTFIFDRMHPEFAQQAADAHRDYLIKQKETLPADIDKQVTQVREQYTTTLVSGTIFRYLIIGAVVGAAGSALLTRRT